METPEPKASLNADLELALQLADLADAVTMSRFFSADLEVHTKPDMTLVSDADRDTETVLRRLLRSAREGDGILGEEHGLEQAASSRQWVIDPIDGTHNYVRQVPVWATLIGLIDHGEPVVGVVSAPGLSRRWWAAKGMGAYRRFAEGEPEHMHVSKVRDLSDAFLSYSSLSGWEKAGLAPHMQNLMSSCWRTRAFGDFWNYMLVAEGAVDIGVEPELALHDMAALVPIVVEAGGTFTNLSGTPGPWGPGGLATNGLLENAVLDVLAE